MHKNWSAQITNVIFGNIFANFIHKTEFEIFMKSEKLQMLEAFITRFALFYRMQLEYQKLKTTTFIPQFIRNV